MAIISPQRTGKIIAMLLHVLEDGMIKGKFGVCHDPIAEALVDASLFIIFHQWCSSNVTTVSILLYFYLVPSSWSISK